jgi:phosphotransferase system HPr (HPr) family protein
MVGMTEKKIIVTIKQGLHARPATEFVKKATPFNCEITIAKNGKSANAKSIMGLMSLAVAQGEEIVLTADGPDEQEAIAALEQILTQGE